MKVKGRLKPAYAGVLFRQSGGREVLVKDEVLEASGIARPEQGDKWPRAWAWIEGVDVIHLGPTEEALDAWIDEPREQPLPAPHHGEDNMVNPTHPAPAEEKDTWPDGPLSRRETKGGKRTFRNPYNFVPFLPRPTSDEVNRRIQRETDEEAKKALERALDLTDGPPPGHHVYCADRYTGWLDVELELATPLLLPDAQRAEDRPGGHKVMPVMLRDGEPWLPPTSLKGALRSAYECITNSRLPRFDGHDVRLGYRGPIQGALSLIPGRVEHSKDGGFQLRPLTGAWLSASENAPWAGQIKHKDHVWAFVTKWEHNKPRGGTFPFWNVEAVETYDTIKPTWTPRPEDMRLPRQTARPISARDRGGSWVEGWVCSGGKSFPRKHDERVFFVPIQNARAPIKLGGDAIRSWKDCIANYQDIHRDEIGRGITGPPALEGCIWSRHITESSDRKLTEGTLCYAQVANGNLQAIYPVMISRTLYPRSPEELLPLDAQPARDRGSFSPADRVFGWVSQERKHAEPRNRAYRGHLRIGPTRCLDDDALVEFDGDGVPLAILGAPKPQQGRFYVGRKDGSAQDDGKARDQTGYVEDRSKMKLRGRKVYPHQKGQPEAVWDDPLDDRTLENLGDGWHQEYRRPRKPNPRPGEDPERDSQNRSVKGWVRKGARFAARVRFDNLSAVELGALVYLLDGGRHGRHLRLGGGKPLGFGSVKSTIKTANVARGDAVRESYLSLDGSPPGETIDIADLRELGDDFVSASKALYKGWTAGDEGLPIHLAAWNRCAVGYDDKKPVHYPRSTSHPHPDGEQFKWFEENNRGPKLALADILTDLGFPVQGKLPGQN